MTTSENQVFRGPLIFFDGIGLGANAEYNPFSAVPMETVEHISGADFVVPKSIEKQHVVFKGIDACMSEFASAACAEILDLEGCVEILMQQASALEGCPAGGMLAILAGADLFEAESVLNRNSELASVNFDSHFVVSGLDEGLRRIIELLKAKNINYQLLPVSQAFHSSHIESAAYNFVQYLIRRDYGSPRVRYISGTYGRELLSVPDTYFWEIVRKPMAFQSAIHGLEENDNWVYVDLGPSGTLANFVKYNLSPDSMSKTCHLITPFGHAEKNLHNLHECLV